MKIINSILSASAIGLFLSCSSTKDLSYEDDIYYEEEAYAPTASANSEFDEYYSYEEEASTQTAEEDYYNPTHSELGKDNESNTYLTNNYYNSNYDYQYSSRIRRFNNCNSGYSYYNPWYTNSYNYGSPYGWNSSIYFGNSYSGYANNSYYNSGMNCCSNNNYWNNYGCNNYRYIGYGNGHCGNNYNGYYGNGYGYYYGNGYGNSSNQGNYNEEQTANNSYNGNHGGGMSSNSLTGSNYGNSSSEDYNTVTAVVKKINPTINMNESDDSNFTASNTILDNRKEIGGPTVFSNATKAPSYNNSLSSLSNSNKFENHDLNIARTTPAPKGNSNSLSRKPTSTNNVKETSSAWKARPKTTNLTSRPDRNNYTKPTNNANRAYNSSKPNNSYTRPTTTKPINNRATGSSPTYKPAKSNTGHRSSAGSSGSRSSSYPNRSSGSSSRPSRSKVSSSSPKPGGRR